MSEGDGYGYVAVVDDRVEALSRLGEDGHRAVGVEGFGHCGADAAEGLLGANPALGAEVDLANLEPGIVGNRALGVVRGDAPEEHCGFALSSG